MGSLLLDFGKDIAADAKTANKVVFLNTSRECHQIERRLRDTLLFREYWGPGSSKNGNWNYFDYELALFNEPFRWRSIAKELGFEYIVYTAADIRMITPKWLGEVSFRSNLLYEWAVHGDTVAVRFNPNLLHTANK